MGWSASRPLGYTLSDAALDAQDNLHYLTAPGNSANGLLNYQAPALAATAGEAVITQTVTLPAGLQSPTLAFLSRMQGGQPRTATYFEVTVTDELTTTEVFRAAQNYTWQHRWVDLQPFAGKTVTLGFYLHQAAGEPPVQVNLDDVSIGSWRTPVVQSVTPWRMQILQDIQVQGDNFLLTPQVWIDTWHVPDGDVSWIDSAHLKVHLSGSLRNGLHDLKVINPGGAEGVLLGALKTGWELFLPGLFR